ncbi:MAG: DedA family protein, partial [Planctomycetia bacterium]|nr:DedA family protein [Planctomycetia bacterium]
SSVGTLRPWGAFVSCLIGALLGDSVIYAIGYHFGHTLVTRHPRFAHLLHAEREARIEEMIRRHGLKVFFLARFMVGIRAPVYLTAGILRMSFRRFVLIDTFCATAVVGLFFGLSYAYGEQLATLVRRSEIGFTVAVVVGVCVVLFYFVWKHFRRKRLEMLNQEAWTACSTGAREKNEVHR